ncbi:hypothetical protein CY35_14G033200 [Sphagnum magellanicum]|nr:hypothetical protein CY35_14G033200 [Sphagnum magellanicum]
MATTQSQPIPTSEAPAQPIIQVCALSKNTLKIKLRLSVGALHNTKNSAQSRFSDGAFSLFVLVSQCSHSSRRHRSYNPSPPPRDSRAGAKRSWGDHNNLGASSGDPGRGGGRYGSRSGGGGGGGGESSSGWADESSKGRMDGKDDHPRIL